MEDEIKLFIEGRIMLMTSTDNWMNDAPSNRTKSKGDIKYQQMW